MPMRNVFLTDHQAGLVAGLVDSGRYRNTGDVIREGLRLIERRETGDSLRLKAMREAVDIGAADIGTGRFRDFRTTGSLRDRLSALTDEALVHRSPQRTDGNR